MSAEGKERCLQCNQQPVDSCIHSHRATKIPSNNRGAQLSERFSSSVGAIWALAKWPSVAQRSAATAKVSLEPQFVSGSRAKRFNTLSMRYHRQIVFRHKSKINDASQTNYNRLCFDSRVDTMRSMCVCDDSEG